MTPHAPAADDRHQPWLSLVRHPVDLLGVIVTTAAATLFLVLVCAMTLGLLSNPYAGLLVFVALPAALLAGLVLIPVGIALERRRQRRHPGSSPWPVLDFASPRTRQITG